MDIRYFDHAATTPVREEVLRKIIPYFGINYGNASSMYSIGRKSRRAVEESRQKVAKHINAKKHEIYFTSCGSESDNLAIKGVAYSNKNKGNHIITTRIEHHAVLNSCKRLEKNGFKVTYLNVDEDGAIDFNELINSISSNTILISIMYANNEIGTIQPIDKIGEIARKNNILFHTDAVQAIGNIKVDVERSNIDLLSMSGHKFYAPKGVGALYVREGVNFDKIQDGGHQEMDKRAGTENVAGIVGIGEAIELIYKDFDNYNKKLCDLRNYYIENITNKIEDIKLNGDKVNRLPGNANISFKGIDGQQLLLELDLQGICASAGSACSTGQPEPSHVLTAIGLNPKDANGALRITFGLENTLEDVDYLLYNLENITHKLKKYTN